jgi:hypothetical protein
VAFPVYSTRLYLGEVAQASGQVTLFTVPAAHRVVVTDLHGQVQTGTGIYLLIFAASTNIPALRVEQAGNSQKLDFTGRIVLHEGESARASSSGTCRFYVSGYILQGGGGPLTPTTLPA